MRVHLLGMLALGVFVGFIGVSLVQAQGTQVDVDKGGIGVHVEKRMSHSDAMSGGKGSIVRSSDIKGLSVYDMDDKSLGKIEDVVIDTRTGQIRYAVLSFGGILGFGDKFFAIPWKKLSFVSKGETTSGTQKEDYCVLNVSKETLEKAPGFNKDAWPNFANTTWQEENDQHYGAKEAHSRRGALR